MTTAEGFRVRCPSCGPQVVAVADVRLLREHTYTFCCPECGDRVRRTADPALAGVLRGAGVVGLAAVDRPPVG